MKWFSQIDPALFSFFGLIAAIIIPLVFWLRKEQKTGLFKFWMNDLNMVTAKVIVSMILAIVAVLVNLLMMILGREVNQEHVESTYWFIFGFAGIDPVMFLSKRATFKPNPGGSDPAPVGEQRTVIERREPIIPHNPNPTVVNNESIPASPAPAGSPPVWG